MHPAIAQHRDAIEAPSLRVCVVREDGQFVAQCVDFNLAADGATVDAAIAAFIERYRQHILVAHELGVEPFADTPPPPEADHFANAWRRAALRIDRPVKRVAIPPFAIVKQGQQVPAAVFGQLEVFQSDAA